MAGPLVKYYYYYPFSDPSYYIISIQLFVDVYTNRQAKYLYRLGKLIINGDFLF